MLSVIIPTYNRPDLLDDCLSKLTDDYQQIPSSDFEVIVSDDSNNSETQKLIYEKYDWVRWVSGPRKGPAANRNSGASHANSEWLVFLDDDCIPKQGWLKAYLDCSKDKAVSVIEGSTVADRPQKSFDEEAPVNTDGNRLWSCNFAIRKSLFIKLNGFDETFPFAAMEDVDFYTRVKEETDISFQYSAQVVHPWRRVKAFRNFKKHLKSHIYFRRKYSDENTFKFRWIRFKIFLGSIIIGAKQLIQFSGRGFGIYIERIVLNWCLIFI